MIISRRKYEQDLKEAYEKGCHETQEQACRDEQIRRLHVRVDELETLIHKLQAPTESSCTNEKTAEYIPLSC